MGFNKIGTAFPLETNNVIGVSYGSRHMMQNKKNKMKKWEGDKSRSHKTSVLISSALKQQYLPLVKVLLSFASLAFLHVLLRRFSYYVLEAESERDCNTDSDSANHH